MNEVKKSGLDKTTVKDKEKYIANAVNRVEKTVQKTL